MLQTDEALVYAVLSAESAHREAVMIECREHRRIPVELQVFFSTTNQTEIREGTMFDISAGVNTAKQSEWPAAQRGILSARAGGDVGAVRQAAHPGGSEQYGRATGRAAAAAGFAG